MVMYGPITTTAASQAASLPASPHQNRAVFTNTLLWSPFTYIPSWDIISAILACLSVLILSRLFNPSSRTIHSIYIQYKGVGEGIDALRPINFIDTSAQCSYTLAH